MIKKASTNYNRLDFGVRRLKSISDKDFVELLSGNINYAFLLKYLSMKSLLKSTFFIRAS